MRLWVSKDLVEATNGVSKSNWQGIGVSIDSRNIKKGEIFLAIKGDNFDGHDYVLSALEKGASGVIVSDVADHLSGKNYIQVEDTQVALENMASYVRSMSTQTNFIAVTGSVGKTTVKEMLREVFAAQGKTHANIGNFNNHIGMPLTLVNMPNDTKWCVLEMGMNHAGEIEKITKIGRPNLAIITTVESVHLENFNTVDEIAEAKAEILCSMQKGEIAVLNRDNRFFNKINDIAHNRGLKVVSFGENKLSDYRLLDFQINNLKSEISADLSGKKSLYKISSIGKHNALNSLAVLAAVDNIAGASLENAIDTIELFNPVKGRGKISKVEFGGGHITLINDCYNASPISVKAAIDNLKYYRQNNNRVIVILGDMLELGPEEKELHKNLVGNMVSAEIDKVFTVGILTKSLYDELPENMKGFHSDNVEILSERLQDQVCVDDVILVKGSNGIKLNKIIEFFTQ